MGKTGEKTWKNNDNSKFRKKTIFFWEAFRSARTFWGYSVQGPFPSTNFKDSLEGLALGCWRFPIGWVNSWRLWVSDLASLLFHPTVLDVSCASISWQLSSSSETSPGRQPSLEALQVLTGQDGLDPQFCYARFSRGEGRVASFVACSVFFVWFGRC